MSEVINPCKGLSEYGWHFEQNVYDSDGLVRSIKSGEGSGNIPKTIEVKKVDVTIDAVIGSMQENAMVGNGDYSPSLTEAMGMGGGQIPMVVEKSSVVVQKCGDRDKEGCYSVHDYSNTIPANPMSDRGQLLLEQTYCRMQGRNPENPSDRTPGIDLEQRLEPNTTGCSNTLTTVQKDNLILEEQVVAYDEQNQTVRLDTFGTLTTDGSSPKHNNRVIKIRQATKQGFIECEVGGGMRFELPDKRIKTGKNNRERSDKSNPDNGEYP